MVNKIKTRNQSFKNLKTQDKKDLQGHTKEEISNRSAGIVIVRKDLVHQQLLVLMMRAYNYWDFPKGKIEVGERVIEAALRETREEAGISQLNFTWGHGHTQTLPYGLIKKVSYYFLAQTQQSEVCMQINPELGRPEHDEYRWVTFEEGYALAVPRIKEVLMWAEQKICDITPEFKEFFDPSIVAPGMRVENKKITKPISKNN